MINGLLDVVVGDVLQGKLFRQQWLTFYLWKSKVPPRELSLFFRFSFIVWKLAFLMNLTEIPFTIDKQRSISFHLLKFVFTK